MNFINDKIQSFIHGISQQSPKIRKIGELEDSVNAIPSIINGWSRRKGTLYIGQLKYFNSAELVKFEDIVFATWFKRSADEIYLALITKTSNNERVLNVYDKEGDCLGPGTSLDGYLNNSNSYSIVNIADTIFVLNKEMKPQLQSYSDENGRKVYNGLKHRALVIVKQANWDTEYKIKTRIGTCDYAEKHFLDGGQNLATGGTIYKADAFTNIYSAPPAEAYSHISGGYQHPETWYFHVKPNGKVSYPDNIYYQQLKNNRDYNTNITLGTYPLYLNSTCLYMITSRNDAYTSYYDRPFYNTGDTTQGLWYTRNIGTWISPGYFYYNGYPVLAQMRTDGYADICSYMMTASNNAHFPIHLAPALPTTPVLASNLTPVSNTMDNYIITEPSANDPILQTVADLAFREHTWANTDDEYLNPWISKNDKYLIDAIEEYLSEEEISWQTAKADKFLQLAWERHDEASLPYQGSYTLTYNVYNSIYKNAIRLKLKALEDACNAMKRAYLVPIDIYTYGTDKIDMGVAESEWLSLKSPDGTGENDSSEWLSPEYVVGRLCNLVKGFCDSNLSSYTDGSVESKLTMLSNVYKNVGYLELRENLKCVSPTGASYENGNPPEYYIDIEVQSVSNSSTTYQTTTYGSTAGTTTNDAGYVTVVRETAKTISELPEYAPIGYCCKIIGTADNNDGDYWIVSSPTTDIKNIWDIAFENYKYRDAVTGSTNYVRNYNHVTTGWADGKVANADLLKPDDALAVNADSYGWATVWRECPEPGSMLYYIPATMPQRLTFEVEAFDGREIVEWHEDSESISVYPITTSRWRSPNTSPQTLKISTLWKPRMAGDTSTNPDLTHIGTPITDMFVYKNRLCLLCGENLVCSGAHDYYRFYKGSALALTDDDPIDVASTYKEIATLDTAVQCEGNLYLISAGNQFRLVEGDGSLLSPKTASLLRMNGQKAMTTVSPIVVDSSIYYLSPTALGVHNNQLMQAIPDQYSGNLIAHNMSAHVSQMLPSSPLALTGSGANGDILYLAKDTPNIIYHYRYYVSGDGQLAQQAWQKQAFARPIYSLYMDGTNVYMISQGKNGKITLECWDLFDGNWDEAVYTDRAGSDDADAYTTEMTLSEILLRDQSRQAVTAGRLQLRKVWFNYFNSRYFTVSVTPILRKTSLYKCLPQLHKDSSETGGAPLYSGIYKVPVCSKAEDVTIKVECNAPYPLHILNGGWEASYTCLSKSL